MRYRNNPLNIRYSSNNRWKGLLSNDNGFCTFISLKYGIRAAAYILMISYRRRGVLSYRQIIYNWAPNIENPTESYLDFVCRKCNVHSDSIPSSLMDFAHLIYCMWIFEQGSCDGTSLNFILSVFREFKLKPIDLPGNGSTADLFV